MRHIVLKVVIQLISIYRAISIFIFILFYTLFTSKTNSILLISAILSDLLDGYLAKKYHLETIGGQLLDLFSDKFLNCISIIFLIIEGYNLFFLLIILIKEIFVLSFRSIKIDGKFVICTNRIIGGIMSTLLWLAVFSHINCINIFPITSLITILGILNFFYLIYKIVVNKSALIQVFKN